MTDLSLVIDRWRRDADALQRNGEPDKAAMLRRCADDCEASAHDYLTFIDESAALLRSGRSVEWFRKQFRVWQPMGHARQVGHGKRVYRLCVLPVRPGILEASLAGRLAASRLRRAS